VEVRLCAIDLSKAFDKVNHHAHALYIKLMKRHFPVKVLLFNRKPMCSSCDSSVKLGDIWLDTFRVDFGVRQGSVLSPYLFAVYLDDLSGLCLSGYTIILYADDILFI